MVLVKHFYLVISLNTLICKLFHIWKHVLFFVDEMVDDFIFIFLEETAQHVAVLWDTGVYDMVEMFLDMRQAFVQIIFMRL